MAHDGRLVLRTADPTHALLSLCSWAVERGLELQALEVLRPTLEDIYLQLTFAQFFTPAMVAFAVVNACRLAC